MLFSVNIIIQFINLFFKTFYPFNENFKSRFLTILPDERIECNFSPKINKEITVIDRFFLIPKIIAFITSMRYHVFRSYLFIFNTHINCKTVTIADTMRTKLVKAIVTYTMQALFRRYHKILRVILVLRVLIKLVIILCHRSITLRITVTGTFYVVDYHITAMPG